MGKPRTPDGLLAYLKTELEGATGTTAEVEPFSFTIPLAGQTGVVKLGGSFAGMELAVPMFVPAPSPVEIDGKAIPAVGRTFSRIVHGETVPTVLDEKTLVIWKIDSVPSVNVLLDTLRGASKNVAAVILYETPGKEPRRSVLAKVVEKGDGQMRIAGFLSREAKPYDGPICFAAVDVEGAFELAGKVTGKAFFVRRSVTVHGSNLSALIRGSGPEGGNEILLTAHFDGLGVGHQGADDNASGVSAVLLAAELLRGKSLRRPVRIVLFDGEEWGLYGSRDYVRRHGDRTGTLVNVDSVGNKGQQAVFLIGRSKNPDLFKILSPCFTGQGFSLGADIDRFAFAYGSDHYPFAQKGIPVMNLYSSNRRVINTTDDRLDKVDVPKVVRIGRALAEAVEMLVSK